LPSVSPRTRPSFSVLGCVCLHPFSNRALTPFP
jgi:hypothetical protein